MTDKPDGKACPKCSVWYARPGYSADKHRPDNMQFYCKKCTKPSTINFDKAGRNCARCKEWKLRCDFHFDSYKSDGMSSSCRVCGAARVQASRGRPPSVRVRTPRTPGLTPEQKKLEETRIATECTRRYRAKNPELHASKKKAAREKTKEKDKVVQRKWIEKNRARVNLYNRMAAGRRRSNGMRNPVETVYKLAKAQKNRCAICNVSIKKKYHIDHIMPLALGGENLPRNLQLLCPPCNLSKRDKHPVDFMRSKGFLI